MRVLTTTMAVLLATMGGVAHAGYPVVVDREGTMQQIAQLQAQLGALDQQIYALRPQNPAAIDHLRIALQSAVQQAQQLDRYVKQAPGAPASPAVVVAPPPRRWDPPVVVAPPAYPPPQEQPPPGWGREGHHGRGGMGGGVIDEGQLGEISQAIQGEAFSKGKLGVLQDAIGRYLFTVDQVKRVIDLFTFSADKLRALELTAPRIVDKQNNFKIYSSFTFSTDKEKARQILSR